MAEQGFDLEPHRQILTAYLVEETRAISPAAITRVVVGELDLCESIDSHGPYCSAAVSLEAQLSAICFRVAAATKTAC